MQPPPLHHCGLNFVPLNVVGNAKIRMYTWIMILEAWNLQKMITAGKYLAIYHFGNWSGDLVGWASGFACKLSTVLQQKLFTSKHWASKISLHCSSQSTCRVKATMLHEGGWPKLIAAFFHHPSCNVQCCQQINIPNNCLCLLALFLRQNRFSWKISNVTSNLTRVSGYQVILVIVVVFPNFIKIHPVKKTTK